MRKGMATETLVKFMVCLFALVILVYLIYRYVLNPGLDPQTCAARMTAWCAQCDIADFTGGPGMGDVLDECINKGYLPGITSTITCDEAKAGNNCQGYLP